MASLYLVRHGQASFGADDYDALSPLGVTQCRRLGEWWRARGLRPVRAITGPMRRHRQSADAFAEGFGDAMELVTLDSIAEFDHENVLEVYRPDFADKAQLARFLAETPKPRQAFHRIFTEAVNRWHDGRFDGEYNEAWPVFRARVRQGLATLCAGRGDAVVFTSGGVVSVMVQQVLSLSDADCFAINGLIHNASVSRLLYSGDEISLHSLNVTAHLDAHDDPTLLTYR